VTLYLAARPNARLVSTRSRIRVATAKRAHPAENCGRPFGCATASDGSQAALG